MRQQETGRSIHVCKFHQLIGWFYYFLTWVNNTCVNNTWNLEWTEARVVCNRVSVKVSRQVNIRAAEEVLFILKQECFGISKEVGINGQNTKSLKWDGLSIGTITKCEYHTYFSVTILIESTALHWMSQFLSYPLCPQTT